MTEAEWLAATDPQPMLECLGGKAVATERKLRLFAASCCRQFWHLLPDGRSQQAVDVAERFADGYADEAERSAADTAATTAARDAILARQASDSIPEMLTLAAKAANHSVIRDVDPEAAGATVAAYRLIARNPDSGLHSRLAVNVASSASLRDIFGNPFRPAPAVDPAWRGGTAAQLAHAAYEHRRLPEGTLNPARLTILADALEDAGCTDADLLGHLRGPGPHVRGCWAVDLILGKS